MEKREQRMIGITTKFPVRHCEFSSCASAHSDASLTDSPVDAKFASFCEPGASWAYTERERCGDCPRIHQSRLAYIPARFSRGIPESLKTSRALPLFLKHYSAKNALMRGALYREEKEEKKGRRRRLHITLLLLLYYFFLFYSISYSFSLSRARSSERANSFRFLKFWIVT